MSKVKIIAADVLEAKTVVELRELCKKYGIAGMSKARKDDIVESILQFYDDLEDSYSSESNETTVDDSKVPYINANVCSFLKNDNSYQTLISVSCGAASSNYPVVGRSAGYVKATYREILNIETDAKAIVNGNEVNDSCILKSGDTLEFVRKAGVKG
jgi:hypothetical protein